MEEEMLTETTAFSREEVQALIENAPEPIECRHDGDLLVWRRPQPNEQYIVAVDPLFYPFGDDFVAMQVIERTSGLQCAEYRGRINLTAQAGMAYQLAHEYNNALLAIEVNGAGEVVSRLVDAQFHYQNFYYHKSVQPGFHTTVRTRALAIEQLRAVFASNPKLFQSRRLFEEWLEGLTDDLTMAMAISLSVRAGIE